MVARTPRNKPSEEPKQSPTNRRSLVRKRGKPPVISSGPQPDVGELEWEPSETVETPVRKRAKVVRKPQLEQKRATRSTTQPQHDSEYATPAASRTELPTGKPAEEPVLPANVLPKKPRAPAKRGPRTTKTLLETGQEEAHLDASGSKELTDPAKVVTKKPRAKRGPRKPKALLEPGQEEANPDASGSKVPTDPAKVLTKKPRAKRGPKKTKALLEPGQEEAHPDASGKKVPTDPAKVLTKKPRAKRGPRKTKAPLKPGQKKKTRVARRPFRRTRFLREPAQEKKAPPRKRDNSQVWAKDSPSKKYGAYLPRRTVQPPTQHRPRPDQSIIFYPIADEIKEPPIYKTKKKVTGEELKALKEKTREEDKVEEEYRHKTLSYCTQDCLLGLLQGGAMDSKCPNVVRHACCLDRHVLLPKVWQQLVKLQLAEYFGNDCKSICNEKTGRGALFRLTLRSHGYCLVAKGVSDEFLPVTLHEARVYEHLKKLQGTCIPIYLGHIKLDEPFMMKDGVFLSHMMLLSWAGFMVKNDFEAQESPTLQADIEKALADIREAGIILGDHPMNNVQWAEDKKRPMIVDFERAVFAEEDRTGVGNPTGSQDIEGRVEDFERAMLAEEDRARAEKRLGHKGRKNDQVDKRRKDDQVKKGLKDDQVKKKRKDNQVKKGLKDAQVKKKRKDAQVKKKRKDAQVKKARKDDCQPEEALPGKDGDANDLMDVDIDKAHDSMGADMDQAHDSMGMDIDQAHDSMGMDMDEAYDSMGVDMDMVSNAESDAEVNSDVEMTGTD